MSTGALIAGAMLDTDTPHDRVEARGVEPLS